MPRYDLSLQDVYVATGELRESDRPALGALASLAQTSGLSAIGAVGLARLARDLEGLPVSISAWEFLAAYLLDRSELVRDMARQGSVPDRMRGVAVWQFLNFVREQSPIASGLRIQRTLDRVRQLVLLAEERDLRQVPAGALHMDAVRLMTVHGSKGLEFEAVHVPGLTVASFPSNNRGQRCPPPIGMIEGAEGLTVSEEARRSQEHEEQCLFFVALSRARTHLRLYLARLQPNGNNRSPSPFLGWIPANLTVEIANPKMLPLPQGVSRPGAVTVKRAADSEITDSWLNAYQKCPRRYFYTHVLGLGAARKSTPFLRTHNCLYELIRWLGETRRSGEPTLQAAEAAFEAECGRIAVQSIMALLPITVGLLRASSRHLSNPVLDGDSGRPNQSLSTFLMEELLLNRTRWLNFRTERSCSGGCAPDKKRTDEYDRLDYTLYHLAGQSRFGAAFTVEAIHLTDDTVETVTITAREDQQSSRKQ